MKINVGPPKLPRWTKTPHEDASLSDWKIQLIAPSDNTFDEIALYSVHRVLLWWNSDYFKKLFEDDRFPESQENQITIKLPSSRVTPEHFERLLDFFYTGELELNSSDVVPMAYFGDYFGISSLKTEIATFIQQSDASHTDLAVYYEDAESLLMQDFIKIIANKCASTPSIVPEDSELFSMANAERFWRLVWLERKDVQPDESEDTVKKWSVNIARLIEAKFELIDKEAFTVFTHRDYLRIISTSAAVLLMTQEHKLGLGDTECGDDNDEQDDLTCLQKRCTEALMNNITSSTAPFTSKVLIKGLVRKVPQKVLEYLLLRMIGLHEAVNPRVPTSVKVSGARLVGADGEYTLAGNHEGKPFFTQKVINSYRFTGCQGACYYAIFFDGDRNFNIACLGKEKNPGISTGDTFYTNSVSEIDLLPRTTGWTAGRYGHSSDVTLEFNFQN